ncbi:hypothetical protein [Erythrobacter sp. F6033]|uniref:hypothetical protein n=1 Tax=Erythrobacter sp. F6033 TaxID=2926401 RepID=UPI001FF5713E|nr:hypothetical protein [Erythrobacter sp. F6033]MCK0127864.1 hypothetical protein [Erythrobacter sp. F6033]
MRILWGAFAIAALSACGSSAPDNTPRDEMVDADTGLESLSATRPNRSDEQSQDEIAKASPKQANVAKKPVKCTAQEETIFYCPITGRKRLAVCAPEQGEAEYRYGGDNPELTLRGGKWANTMYSGGGEAQILFSNGDIDYIVFSRMVRTNFAEGEPNYPAITDGVVVSRGEEVLSIQLCEGGQAIMPVQYDAAERAFGATEDIFTGATDRADP